MEKEILQDLESPKWRRRLVIYILIFAVLTIAFIIFEIYASSGASIIGNLLWPCTIWLLAIASFISSLKHTARHLAIDDTNLIFKCIIGTTSLPLSEIASIEKADNQLYGRKKDKLNEPDRDTKRIFGQKNFAFGGWCKRGTEHKYFLFSAQRDNHALITTKDGELYIVDYENTEAIKRKAGLI